MGKPLFINFDSLQVGSFLDSGEVRGEGWVKFLPLNSVRSETIEAVDLSKNNFISVPRIANVRGTYTEVKVLITGTGGQSRFLEGVLGLELPDVLRIVKRQREDLATQQSAIRTERRIRSMGERKQVQDLATKMQILETGRRPREPEWLRRRRKRRFY